MNRIRIGGAGPEIARIGLGSWAIGGPCMDNGTQMGWGDVDDGQSIRAIHAALDMGANYIDTANIYGAGHSEAVVGRAVKGRRDQVVLSTKFGILCDEREKRTTGTIQSMADVRRSCEDSLRRLGTDYIDLLLFHLGSCPEDMAAEVRDTLEALADEGKIRYYGWSTERADLAAIFAEGPRCAAFMHIENLFEDTPGMIDLCQARGMASLCRSPLCMGLLTGKYGAGARFADNDLRGRNAPAWMNYFVDGRPNPAMMRRLDAVRDVLTAGGRTLAQGCLAWLWARSPVCVPVPGFRTEAQVRDNVGALALGALTPAQMDEIAAILSADDERKDD